MAAGGRAALALALLAVAALLGPARGWDQPGRVLLREVQALTLYRDQYTTSRRTSPVLQLQCTGGSAGCSYVPAVVQCHNKGWDGFDIQWECKADLDISYRFGRTEVSCEGYDYPDDPYILKGSCGLEYSTGMIIIIVLLVLAYGVYKLFLSNLQPQQDFSDGDGYSRPSGQNYQAPPPPGFKSSFTGAGGLGGGSGYQANSGAGFWTGLGTGGLLGYLAGNQRGQSHSYFPHFSSWTGPTAAPPTWGNSCNSTQPGSSGTRTASGYGGTKRRPGFNATLSQEIKELPL
ncbi:store-operated calcium entry-associated regulatory factor isoform C [Alligator mississippiensis]|uniref:Store-operated calcium entry-associated regulatory factor n=1 Tax=Alligator mississippiensis TaxID=8496 RepID=A0A151MPP7_ALLMI|nr:store-operated calcium entry-associated regulatory factor isoform C [Alligator mississippiensis]